MDLSELIADLRAEYDELDALVEHLSPAQWKLPTPAASWTVQHQIAHLSYFDHAAQLALTDPELFRVERERADKDSERYSEEVLVPLIEMSGEMLVDTWRASRASLLATAGVTPTGERWPWYGPSMSLASMLTARLMETWAHGQDVVDALGLKRLPTKRLRHVAYIAFRARAYSYEVRGAAVPDAQVRVELLAPADDETWVFGPHDATDSIRGSALDFALVMTRRRHHADTGLVADGAAAAEWLELGQAFAGSPGTGRQPGQFPR